MRPLIEAKDISKIYTTGDEEYCAVNNVSIELYPGDFTVIMGSSGSGKTTLMYLLSGLDSLSAGHVSFEEQHIDRLSEKDMAAFRTNKIGYVYQGINLVPDMTILENIEFPGYILGLKKSDVRKKALDLMDAMGIAELKDRFPSQVSGGQQQRAAIARAIINSPEVVFADEPTGNLSQEYGTAILDILTEMNRKGQSVIMVTHDVKAACRADRLIHFKDGKIIGILELDKYRAENLKSREARIYSYLAEKSNGK